MASKNNGNIWNLTDKHMRLIEEYICNGYNGVAAYASVYGCPPSNVGGNAAKILKKPEAQQYMQYLQKERIAAMGITADRVLEELATMAFAQKGDEHYNASAKLKALDLLQKQMGLQKQQIKAEVDGTVDINVNITE